MQPKTSLMREAEKRTGKNLKKILKSYPQKSIRQISKEIGVKPTTVWEWIQKLNREPWWRRVIGRVAKH